MKRINLGSKHWNHSVSILVVIIILCSWFPYFKLNLNRLKFGNYIFNQRLLHKTSWQWACLFNRNQTFMRSLVTRQRQASTLCTGNTRRLLLLCLLLLLEKCSGHEKTYQNNVSGKYLTKNYHEKIQIASKWYPEGFCTFLTRIWK